MATHPYLHCSTPSCPTRRSADVFAELARLVQVTAMYDPMDHDVGAGRGLRQCLEQGGKALLRIRADRNLGPGALDQARLRTGPSSVQEIRRALEGGRGHRSEEHTSALQSLMRNSYAVFCLKKQKQKK